MVFCHIHIRIHVRTLPCFWSYGTNYPSVLLFSCKRRFVLLHSALPCFHVSMLPTPALFLLFPKNVTVFEGYNRTEQRQVTYDMWLKKQAKLNGDAIDNPRNMHISCSTFGWRIFRNCSFPYTPPLATLFLSSSFCSAVVHFPTRVLNYCRATSSLEQ